jgi:hypothetical protein
MLIPTRSSENKHCEVQVKLTQRCTGLQRYRHLPPNHGRVTAYTNPIHSFLYVGMFCWHKDDRTHVTPTPPATVIMSASCSSWVADGLIDKVSEPREISITLSFVLQSSSFGTASGSSLTKGSLSVRAQSINQRTMSS